MIADPGALDLAAWNEHAPMLGQTFPGWTFARA